MVLAGEEEETLVYGIKLSSVGPGRVTGQDVVHEPANLDLATKLHYIRGVYYFRSAAVQGLTVPDIKEPMFFWLNHFSVTCGRFRRSDSGRPYIKCNDCGVRFVEAHCAKTLDEWLEMVAAEESGSSTSSFLHKLLFPNEIIGPELFFSPLVFVQVTRFKCGGMSMGLSWAHVLGDPFSAVDCMNAWNQAMADHQPSRPIEQAQSHTTIRTSPNPPAPSEDPLSVKRVESVGDKWIIPNNSKMETFSLHLTTKQIIQLQSKVCGQVENDQIPVFECLCGVIWKIVTHIRDGPEPKLVTICKNDKNNPHSPKNGVLSNGQVISVVKADFSIIDANPKELAKLVINGAVDERSKIEEAVERDQGVSDFVTYGANLTFVDLEQADLYGMELKGHKPVYVSYTIDGVGDEGAVLVLPGPKGGKGGKVVTLIMPKNEILDLKSELKKWFSIA